METQSRLGDLGRRVASCHSVNDAHMIESWRIETGLRIDGHRNWDHICYARLWSVGLALLRAPANVALSSHQYGSELNGMCTN